MPLKDISYLQLWWPLCSAEWDHLCNFGRRHYEEHFCEILNLDQWFQEILFKLILIFSSCGTFVQQSRTISAISEEGLIGNRPVKLF